MRRFRQLYIVSPVLAAVFAFGCSGEDQSDLAASQDIELTRPNQLGNAEYSFGDCLTPSDNPEAKLFIQDGEVLPFNETHDATFRSSKITLYCYLEDQRSWRLDDIRSQGRLNKLLDEGGISGETRINARISNSTIFKSSYFSWYQDSNYPRSNTYVKEINISLDVRGSINRYLVTELREIKHDARLVFIFPEHLEVKSDEQIKNLLSNFVVIPD